MTLEQMLVNRQQFLKSTENYTLNDCVKVLSASDYEIVTKINNLLTSLAPHTEEKMKSSLQGIWNKEVREILNTYFELEATGVDIEEDLSLQLLNVERALKNIKKQIVPKIKTIKP